MGQEQKRTVKRAKAPKQRRRMRYGLFLLGGLILIAACLILVLTRKADLAASSVSLPFSANDSYALCDKGIVYYKDGAIHALNTSGDEMWYSDFAGENVKIAASSSLVAVCTPSTLHVFNQKGEELFTREFLGTISSVSCSDSLVCVYRKTTKGSDISVINNAGADVNTIDMGTQNAVALGIDDKLQMIWTLTLDTSADTPVTRISTYSGGSTINGLITVDTHLVKGALFSEGEVYALGSTHVMCYDYKGSMLSSQLVYGWNVEDASMGANKKPLLILTPRTKGSAGSFAYPMARLISYGVSESLLYLPSECFQVQLGNEKIYCFTPKAVHVYNLNGEEKDSYPLGITIDRVSKPFGGNYVLAFSGQACTLIPLP
ncbi:MAG: DUF5711 family protein [Bacillota bacterium]